MDASDKRKIFLNSKWSDDPTLDLIMVGTSPIPNITSKTSEIDIATADGTIDTSRSSGRLRFQAITIPYVFTHAIPRYNQNGTKRSVNEMNRLANEHRSAVENWAYAPEAYGYNPQGGIIVRDSLVKFYDTGICDPTEQTGYWLPNPRCSDFAAAKSISSDYWIIQYQIQITTDPYMYEYSATPRTYAMFSGPNTDLGIDGVVRARIYTKTSGTAAWRRYLWTNDNIQWILTDTCTQTVSPTGLVYQGTWSFKPSTQPIYTGSIGLYMASMNINYTYNDVLYQYNITNIRSTSGTCEFINSTKIVTDHEMALTNQNGCVIVGTVNDVSGNFADLVTATNGHIPMPFIWGVAKEFTSSSLSTQYMINGRGPVTSFNKVTGPSLVVTINFGVPFGLDDDGYNEFQMNTTEYGFYTLESPDNARRKI